MTQWPSAGNFIRFRFFVFSFVVVVVVVVFVCGGGRRWWVFFPDFIIQLFSFSAVWPPIYFSIQFARNNNDEENVNNQVIIIIECLLIDSLDKYKQISIERAAAAAVILMPLLLLSGIDSGCCWCCSIPVVVFEFEINAIWSVRAAGIASGGSSCWLKSRSVMKLIVYSISKFHWIQYILLCSHCGHVPVWTNRRQSTRQSLDDGQKQQRHNNNKLGNVERRIIVVIRWWWWCCDDIHGDGSIKKKSNGWE